MKVLAIDPGNIDSGWCIIDTDDCTPLQFDKTGNDELLARLSTFHIDEVVIEMIASYGMPVGAEVFSTCVWVGRFMENMNALGIEVTLTFRREVKLHLCGTARAKDANITQALVDRFALGEANHGKGTKAEPGFFYGFKADVWAAFALAVLHADTHNDAAQLIDQVSSNCADTAFATP